MLASKTENSLLRVTILMPLRDDWASAAELIRRLDRMLGSYPCILNILLVDDGSIEICDAQNFQSQYSVVRSIQILRLRRNLGHQRAIAIGIVRAAQAIPCDAVLVMDADGEDTPEGVLQLLRVFSEEYDCTKAIFAERSRRTESFAFRISYKFYKILHRILTGVSVRVGNFSIFPAAYIDRLVVMSELWNHYAAAVFRSGLPFSTTPISRGYRIKGKSRMNFVSLVSHGMSAISVFGDVVGVRLLIASMAGSLIAVLGILAVIFIRLFTNKAIPGWATYTVGALFIILIQFITIATSFTFTMLSNRVMLNFVPLRDYELFVLENLEVYRVD
jgi:glycosyltransferase involved in cell wall biosynthesis